MATMKKTFRVQDLKNQVNSFLAESRESLSEQREGAIHVLTSVLHETGNYAGFRYLEQHEIGIPNKPGIRPELEKDKWFEDTDSTRVHYF